MFDDKKDQKELQDLCQKLLEACSEIAGAQLEQKSLLSRSLVVKQGTQVDIDDEHLHDSNTNVDVSTKNPGKPLPPVIANGNRHYAVHALVLKAELTATLLDMVYRSEEKDKVTPFLVALMCNVFPYLKNHRKLGKFVLDMVYRSEEKDKVTPFLVALMCNVFPYLKNHSFENLPSLRGCSQLVASLSSYQYTRRAWKKEAFDLLMDPAFFQMDMVCVGHWKVIIDNLMTNDKTTFRDLLAKVVVAPSASLNLFTSREQEWEQRCQLLKRLTFVIFCSEEDQYQRAMPDIQERLSDCLRPPLVPIVQAQAFYCFRVLLLRISQHNIMSLWPTICTELVQVMLILEQELAPDPSVKGEFPLPGLLDLLSSSNSGLTGGGVEGHPGWLRLYLAACKLLDMVLCLPSSLLPHFQLYKWAFVGEMPEEDHRKARRSKEHQLFYPHIIRIAMLMRNRFGDSTVLEGGGKPLLTVRSIKSVKELHPFFTTLAWGLSSNTHRHLNTTMAKSKSAPDGFKGQVAGLSTVSSGGGEGDGYVIKVVENMVQSDFLEPMGSK